VPALKLGALFKQLAPNGGFSHTFGCLDPVQVVQMASYLSTIYVSGWQSSSTASTTNEPGPDLADYPYTSQSTDHARGTLRLRLLLCTPIQLSG